MNESVCFRREFLYNPAEWPGIRGVKLELKSDMPSVEAWLNGKPLRLPPKGIGEVKLNTEDLIVGRNLLAIRVSPSEGSEEFVKPTGGGRRQSITYGANLFPRPNSEDEVLRKSELEQLGLFRSLSRMPNVDEFPNSIVLRKYAPGEVICYQGEPGSSAFYILSTEDLYRLRCSQAKFLSATAQQVKPANCPPEKLRKLWDDLETELRHLEQDQGAQTAVRKSTEYQTQLSDLLYDIDLIQNQLLPFADLMHAFKLREDQLKAEIETGRLKDADEETIKAERQKLREERRTATVHIIPGANRVTPPRSWVGRLTRRLFGAGGLPEDQAPTAIRNDGPSDVDYKTRQAPMFEGDLFGEMACMTNSPRSATITADGEVYMLEFLKNVFTLIQRDDKYREQILEKFRERVLSTHLDRLEFFQGLTSEQKATLSDALDLKIVDAGTVIFNEEEPSDCVYIIRTGLVQVVKGIRGMHVAINAEAINDWKEFAQELLKGDPGLEIPCPKCKSVLRLFDRQFLGRKGRCPNDECGHKFVLTDPDDSKLDEEIELTPAGASSGENAGKKPQSTKDKIAAMKAKMSKKKTGSEPVKKVSSSAEKIAQMKAKMAKKKAGGEPAKKASSSAEKIAQMKAKMAQKKAGGESPPQAMSAAERIAAKKKAGGASAKKSAMPKKKTSKKKKDDPHDFQKAVWNALSTGTQDAIRRVANGQAQPNDVMHILVGLNDLIKSGEMIGSRSPNFCSLITGDKAIATFPNKQNDWTGLQACVAGRLILQKIYPDSLKKPAIEQEAGPIRILAYLSSGDILGEMGVVQNKPRTATCVAWDHPNSGKGPKRTPGQVHLISIKKEAFDNLMADPVLAERVKMLIEKRNKADSQYSDQPTWRDSSIISSPEFQDQGFVQGQKLMLIDLDSCTRCGDCVRACMDTHEDGYSRLFLDGPRFDRFLVPSACRNCIDPACMIGCPVGSIQKGENGQIVIRNWCIGCEICSKQCPYDSIQMHDTGMIATNSAGWKYMAESAVSGLNWYQPKFKDESWSDGIGPFLWDLDFRDQLKTQNQNASKKTKSSNGEESQSPPDATSKFLKYRDTVLEVRLDGDKLPPVPPGQESFDSEQLRLRALPKVAVLCDQCSERKNGQPACVEHCPHEAAMRINARFEFPIGMKAD